MKPLGSPEDLEWKLPYLQWSEHSVVQCRSWTKGKWMFPIQENNLLATYISEQVLSNTYISEQELRNNLSLNIYLIFLQYLLHISSRYQSFEISCLENFGLEERQPLAAYLEHKPQPERRLHMQDILNGWGGKRSAEKQRGAWEFFSINSTCIFFCTSWERRWDLTDAEAMVGLGSQGTKNGVPSLRKDYNGPQKRALGFNWLMKAFIMLMPTATKIYWR